MATFGDLRSMIASRDWARWHVVDLAHLSDAPLGLAQEYARPHVHEAMWGVPVVPAKCKLEVDLRRKVSFTARMKIGRGWTHIWVPDDPAGLCDRESAQVIHSLYDDSARVIMDLKEHLRAGGLIREIWRRPFGESRQAQAVLMRCAALLARGWPVTLEHAKAAIQPRPEAMHHTCYRHVSHRGFHTVHGQDACKACIAGCDGSAPRAQRAYDKKWGFDFLSALGH